MNEIDLGFLEECPSWRLESRFFPSKVGGKPAWLNLEHPPSSDDVQCDVCRAPCIFLCQIYAPYEEEPQAFHRTLYVFICKKETCCKPNSNGNLKVFRSQLPRENAFYSCEPPEENEDWTPDIRAEKWTKICRVCGILAPKCCAKCKSANYCCREHQVWDWTFGHKQQCDTDISEQNRTLTKPGTWKNILFPELEIVMESESKEDSENDGDDAAKEAAEMERFEALVKSGKAGTLQSAKEIDSDLQNMAQAETDETFEHFSEQTKRHPDQVLRYDRGGTPLYVSSGGRPSHIPNCEQCNSQRQFEFQIMPQLLNYLGFDDVLKSLDWGTLLIYTCQNSCAPKSAYTPEYIWKQDIV